MSVLESENTVEIESKKYYKNLLKNAFMIIMLLVSGIILGLFLSNNLLMVVTTKVPSLTETSVQNNLVEENVQSYSSYDVGKGRVTKSTDVENVLDDKNWVTFSDGVAGLKFKYPFFYNLSISSNTFKLESPELFYWIFNTEVTNYTEYKNLINIYVYLNPQSLDTISFIKDSGEFDSNWLPTVDSKTVKELILEDQKPLLIDGKKGIATTFCGWECNGQVVFIANKENFYKIITEGADQTGSKLTETQKAIFSKFLNELEFL